MTMPARFHEINFLSPSEPIGVRRRADTATILAILVVIQLLVPSRLVLSGVPLSITPANVIGLGLALLWLFSQMTTTLGAAKGSNPVRTIAFIYTCTLLATYGVATFGYLPSDELNLTDHTMVIMLGLIGMTLAACDGINGRQRLDFVLKSVVVVGSIVATIAAIQYLTTFDPTVYFNFPGLRATSDDGLITVREGLRRVNGTTAHPIELGVMCAMILPLAIHYGLEGRVRKVRAFHWWLCVSLLACGIAFSISRSAVLGTAGVLIVLLFAWPYRRRIALLAIVFGSLLATRLLAPSLFSAFYSLFANIGDDSSIQYRTHDYSAVAEAVAEHPLLGRGLGTWYAPKYQVFDNQYLLSLVEVGVLGTLSFVGVMIVGVYAALRARNAAVDSSDRDLGLALAASLVVPIIGSATFDLAGFKMVAGLTFLLVGSAGALLRGLLVPRRSDSFASKIQDDAG